jgi:hypothetical protein
MELSKVWNRNVWLTKLHMWEFYETGLKIDPYLADIK